MRHRDNLLPITFTILDEGGGHYGDVQLFDVTFLEDFGPWHKGQQINALALDHCKAELSEYDDAGEIVATVRVKLVTAQHLLPL